MTTQHVQLHINGQAQDVVTDPDTALLTLLRQDVGLMGARIGCGQGNCGACTVLVDGRAVQSCNTPLWSVAGKSVVTMEAADQHPLLPKVREAFLAEQAAQCAYCINGIMATVAALLSHAHKPDRAEVIKTLDERHLCRCGAHPRILRAIDRLLASPVAA